MTRNTSHIHYPELLVSRLKHGRMDYLNMHISLWKYLSYLLPLTSVCLDPPSFLNILAFDMSDINISRSQPDG